MAKKLIKTTYNAGEMSPLIDGRTDLSKYYNGCSKLVNGTVLPYGGITKRSGTEWIAITKEILAWVTSTAYILGDTVVEAGVSYFCIVAHTSGTFATDLGNSKWLQWHATELTTSKVKLFEFEFSATDTMILEMGNYYTRFIQSGVQETITKASITNWAVDTNYSINDIVEDNAGSSGYYYASTTHKSDAADMDVDLALGYWIRLTEAPLDSDSLLYEIQTPYSSSEIFDIHITESADVLYLAHTSYFPRKMSRLATNSWTIEIIPFDGGPFLNENVDPNATLTFSHYVGVQDGGNNQSILTDSTATFIASTLIGFTIYNLTDNSNGLITANSTTTITATLSGGTDDDWDDDDVYEIGLSSGFYHIANAVGTLTASGATPFVDPGHVGSEWELIETRIGDNYTTIVGITADGVISSAVEILGDFNVSVTGLSGVNVATVILQRKEGDGSWQNVRKFTAAASYSATELIKTTFYRLRYTGATTGANFNATLTASNQITKGRVEIINVVSTTVCIAVVKEKVFITPTQEAQSMTDLNKATSGIVTVLSGSTVAIGDTIIFKGITHASYSFLNLDPSNNQYTVLTSTAGVSFTFNSGVAGNLASDATGIGEFYVLGEDSATSIWAEGAWSNFRGYPVSVTFFESRLWWAGTDNNPQTLWGSRTDDFENQTSGTLADDAIKITIQDNNMSAIEWIAARRSLIAGTANKEYAIRANNIDDPITPNDIKASPQSTHGSNHIQAQALNDGLFYIQRSGRKMWIMKFSFADEEFASVDATLLAEHLLESSPVDMAIQSVPESMVWLIRTDGVLLSFTYNSDEEVAAWARHVTGTMSANLLNGKATPDALFESIAIVSGSIEDDIYVSVQRVIDGSTVRYIEKFSTRFIDQIDEVLMLDSAIIVTTGFESQDIILASDTVRYGEGNYGSSFYGGTFNG